MTDIKENNMQKKVLDSPASSEKIDQSHESLVDADVLNGSRTSESRQEFNLQVLDPRSLVESQEARETVEELEVSEAVNAINSIYSESSARVNPILCDMYLQIGKYVLDKFFNGDIKAARSKSPTKKNSYQSLCDNAELLVSKKQLSISVRIAAQDRLLSYYDDIDTSALTYTHRGELIKLDTLDDNLVVETARKCINETMPYRALSEEITNVRAESKGARQPSTAPLSVKRLGKGLGSFSKRLKTYRTGLPKYTNAFLSNINSETKSNLNNDISAIESELAELKKEISRIKRKLS